MKLMHYHAYQPNWFSEIIISIILFFIIFLSSYCLYLSSALHDAVRVQQSKNIGLFQLTRLHTLFLQDQAMTHELQRWKKENTETYVFLKNLSTKNDVLSVITQCARQTGFSLLLVKPGTATQQSDNTLILTMTGAFQNLFYFFQALDRLPYPVMIESLELKQDAQLQITYVLRIEHE